MREDKNNPGGGIGSAAGAKVAVPRFVLEGMRTILQRNTAIDATDIAAVVGAARMDGLLAVAGWIESHTGAYQMGLSVGFTADEVDTEPRTYPTIPGKAEGDV